MRLANPLILSLTRPDMNPVANLPLDADLGHRAWALAQAGQFAESLELYQQMAQADPDHLEPRWRLADRLINLGRAEEALQHYEAARAAALEHIAQGHPDPPTRGSEGTRANPHARWEDHATEALMGIRYAKWLIKNPDRLVETGLVLGYHGAQGDPDSGPVPDAAAAFATQSQAPDTRRADNLALNQQEFQTGKLTLQSLPPWLYLESTTKCNFFCQTCSKGYAPYFAEDLHDDVLDHARQHLMPVNTRISITGFGEPTLSTQFDTMLEMAVRNGSFVHFVTNASLLSVERLHQITRLPVMIMISFDGGTASTFEEIRKGSNFALTMERLAMIRKLRNIHLGAARSEFVFNFVALRRNAPELAEVVRIAHRFQISSVGVTDYFFNYNEFDQESLQYEPELANRCFSEAQSEAERLGVALSLPPYFQAPPPVMAKASFGAKIRKALSQRWLPAPRRFPRRCTSPWSEPYIRNNGVVSMCCLTSDAMGSLKTHSFVEIWNNWRYRFLRWRINTPLPPPTCRNCFIHWGINGGNPGNVKAQEGLLIKLWYKAEQFLTDRLPQGWRWLKTRFGKITPEPEPNYAEGRPLKADRPRKTNSAAPSMDIPNP